ncbi:PD-(D/E)XK nuclease family transposase, partial [Bacillus thuringiensis]|uniref:PD-(D/E)XK nuclease family transposase n=1 Tax=Bacillus thuringiensis TaxID=1428 RepID=UPI00119FB313
MQHPHVHKQYKHHKLSIIHLPPTLPTPQFLNIQIQIPNNHHIQKPSFYYSSKFYPSQIQQPIPYTNLHKPITINLLHFILFPIHHPFQTTPTLSHIQKQLFLTQHIQIHHLQLPNLIPHSTHPQLNPSHHPFLPSLLFLPPNQHHNLTHTLHPIPIQQHQTLHQPIHNSHNITHNHQFPRDYEAPEKILLDQKTPLAHAQQKGVERG